MRIRLEQRFPAPLESVEAAFVDPDFLEHLGTLPKLGRPHLLDQRAEGPLVHQRVRYAFAGELSGVVRRALDPARLTWVEESTLDRRTHRTSFRVLPDHYASRLSCSGTFALEPDGDGACRRLTEADLKVTVPFVGSKVEAAIASGLAEHAGAEVAVLERWLAARRH